jgi:hypothetical protein
MAALASVVVRDAQDPPGSVSYAETTTVVVDCTRHILENVQRLNNNLTLVTASLSVDVQYFLAELLSLNLVRVIHTQSHLPIG